MLEPGSLLVLYSDGLVERRRERPGLGLRRLERAAVALGDVAIDEVCDRLVAALGVEAVRDDDVAVLAVRLLPAVGYDVPSCLPGTSRRAPWAPRRDARVDGRPGRCRAGARCAAARGGRSVRERCRARLPRRWLGRRPRRHRRGGGPVVRGHRPRLRAIPDRPAGSDDRGRGTDIMRKLATDFSRHSTPSGTTVRFRLPMDVPMPA